MAIGDKIKTVRMRRDMTQKELGLALGFPQKSADIRIAQYEAGTRVPKEKLISKIAETLEVNPSYLTAPASINKKDIMNFLFYLDEYEMIDLNPREENIGDDNIDESICVSFYDIDHLLKEWFNQKKLLEAGIITEEEYFNWKSNWSQVEEEIKTMPKLEFE